MEIIRHRRPTEVVDVVDVAAVFRFKLNGLGALAAVYGFIRKLVERLFVAGVVRTRQPEWTTPLEAVLDHLLPVDGSGESQHQADRRRSSPSFHASLLLA